MRHLIIYQLFWLKKELIFHRLIVFEAEDIEYIFGFFLFYLIRAPPTPFKFRVWKEKEMKKVKRRKYKDNPYRLLFDNDNYYIIYKDKKGIINKVEVSINIYDAFNSFELDDLSELNEYDNHIEHLELDEDSLYIRSSNKEESLDDYVIRKTSYEELMIAINKLPEIEKRRIKKYYFDEKTQQQIANEEGVNIRSIQYSLNIALKKLKEFLK